LLVAGDASKYAYAHAAYTPHRAPLYRTTQLVLAPSRVCTDMKNSVLAGCMPAMDLFANNTNTKVQELSNASALATEVWVL